MADGRVGVATSVWDMIVFQKAYAAALEIHRIAQTFPKHEQYELASQLRRSSKSICANLAEGRARQQGSTAEFRRFALIALGSTDESALWCRFAKDLGYLTEDQFQKLSGQYVEIAKMLNGLIAKLK
ncbi:four helix bundle protein [Terricaulis silvestris]|uniref:Four helix bundle protein n=1 Tax=Terricaulis silvestris TaxID=2686094 RepID=A0A6I6MS91_9CAUL|nr:four helix bundle protein [Terricaulis silvestris]QGZ96296.1 four helix bundle protein [Terricaulis silvestris]